MNKSKNRIALAVSIACIALLVGVVVILFLTMDNTDVTPDAPVSPSYENQITYEEYNSLSGEEQEAYFNTFPSIESFFEWYNAARDEYEKNNPTIEIGDDTIDIGNFGK